MATRKYAAKDHIFGWQTVALRHGWPRRELDAALASLESCFAYFVREVTPYKIGLIEVRRTPRMEADDPEALKAFLEKHGLQAAPSFMEYEVKREIHWNPTPESVQTAPVTEDPWCPSHGVACEPTGWQKCGAKGIISFETCSCGRVHFPGCEILKQRKEYHDQAAKFALAAAAQRFSLVAVEKTEKPVAVMVKPRKLDRKRVLPGQLRLL